MKPSNKPPSCRSFRGGSAGICSDGFPQRRSCMDGIGPRPHCMDDNFAPPHLTGDDGKPLFARDYLMETEDGNR